MSRNTSKPSDRWRSSSSTIPLRLLPRWTRASTDKPTKTNTGPDRRTFNIKQTAFANSREDSEHSASQEQNGRSDKSLSILSHWWQEILACILSISMLFALIAILYTRQDQPLPQWPYRVSVNTVISILSLILKASMIFALAEGLGELKWAWYRSYHALKDIEVYDQASRGPWGSLRLVAMLKHRHLLSSLGAVVIIVALALEPFAQQVLQYYTCPVNNSATSPASLPRTSYYRGLSTMHVGAGMSTADFGIQSNAYGGIFGNPVPAAFDCPQGNCTFDPFATLGYCASCQQLNVTEVAFLTMVRSSSANTRNGALEMNWTWPSAGLNLAQDARQTNVTQNTFDFLVSSPANGHGFGPHVDLNFLIGNSYWTAVERPSDGQPTWAPVYENCSSPGLTDTWPCANVGAATCRMNVCVKEIQSKVENGTLSEKVISTSDNFTLSTTLSTLDRDCVDPKLRDQLIASGFMSAEPRWQKVQVGSGIQKGIPDGCFHQLEIGPASSISYFIGEFLRGTVSWDGRRGQEGNFYPTLTTGPVQLQRLYKTGNITIDSLEGNLKNMTDSITTYMRENGVGNASQPTLGSSFRYDTCVRVEWGWLALPASLVTISVVFLASLILSIRLTHSGSRSAWKTSALALMYHGLDREVLDRDGGRLHQLKEMKQSASRLRVRLQPSGRGWKLVDQKDG